MNNISRFIFCSTLLLMLPACIFAQHYLGVKVSQNATSLPITGIPSLFKSPFHPGFIVTYETSFHTKNKYQFRNEINAGLFYHRFFQLGIQLSDIVKYQYNFNPRWAAFTGLGGGYMHSFYQYNIFKLNSEGVYDKISLWKGRPQFTGIFVIGASMGLKKTEPEKIRLSLEFRSFVHGTFAKSYVPIVPYNSVLVGIGVRSAKKDKSNSNDNTK